jgi:hypothetical protein
MKNAYVVVGNLLANVDERFEGYSLDQIIKCGEAPDGRGGILRVTYSYVFFHSSNDDNFSNQLSQLLDLPSPSAPLKSAALSLPNPQLK